MQQKLRMKILALILLSPFLITCKPIGANSGFDFTLGQNSTILIDATTSSCAGVNSGTLDSNIGPNYFQLASMNIKWTSSNPLTIQFVRFTITSPDVNNGQEYVCTLASTDLLNTWVFDWNVPNSSSGLQCMFPVGGVSTLVGSATPPSAVTITNGTTPAGVGLCNIVGTANSCPFSCGGITMTNPARSSSGVVNVTVYATYSSGNGNSVPLTVTKPLNYTYFGFSQ
jgi:hypothetical protein